MQFLDFKLTNCKKSYEKKYNIIHASKILTQVTFTCNCAFILTKT